VWRRFGETMIGLVASRLGAIARPPLSIYSAYVPTDKPSRRYCTTLWWRESQFLLGLLRPGRKMWASWPSAPNAA
jgi:hypothetical protein